MSYLENYTETEETDSEHKESDDEEIRMAEYLEKRGLKIDEYGDVVEDTVSTVQKVICSCGHYTCCMVGRYGHPLPVFTESIEPLYPQSARDELALKLKEEVN